MKDFIIRFRVEKRHKDRLAELSQQCGLMESEVLRKLIENSRLETLSAPVSVFREIKHLDHRSAILECLKTYQPLTARQISEMLSIRRDTVHTVLRQNPCYFSCISNPGRTRFFWRVNSTGEVAEAGERIRCASS